MYREFQAKTVDQAIEDACRYFAASRESLEIDILRGGSAGIFGLGAKKALVRVRKRILESSTTPEPEQVPLTRAEPEAKPVPPPAVQPVEIKPAPLPSIEPEALHTSEPDVLDDLDDFDEGEDSPHTIAPMSAEDKASLETAVREVMRNLLQPICPGSILTVYVHTEVIRVHIADDENSGLVIGRDGHTITALQYLANRIIAKTWPRSPRIQLDAGEYRQKQAEQLERIALVLSEKAKKSGKVQSTKPLSSYHRRVVHVALQPDRGVQTRSKGDGPLKRVLIVPVKRHKPGQRATRPQTNSSTSPALQE